jgi:hypothetical protein
MQRVTSGIELLWLLGIPVCNDLACVGAACGDDLNLDGLSEREASENTAGGFVVPG